VRPPVTVICPFAGSEAELDETLRALAEIELRDGDELLIADNRPRPRPGLVDASGPASSYFARGVAAARARGEWLVFVDADTRPEPGLLDAYFDPPPGERVAVLAGAIVDEAVRDTRVARYVTGRRKLDQDNTLAHPRRPYAQTANCAVRRAAFEAVGGFPDPVRSGADADLCWRLQAAGWELEPRPGARVRHISRARLRELLAQLHRHGSGMQWLDRRWPGSFPPPAPRELLGRFRMLARELPRDPGGATLDFLALWARDLGRLRANGDPTPFERPA
jgi:GT2 family glycosyltransferase